MIFHRTGTGKLSFWEKRKIANKWNWSVSDVKRSSKRETNTSITWKIALNVTVQSVARLFNTKTLLESMPLFTQTIIFVICVKKPFLPHKPYKDMWKVSTKKNNLNVIYVTKNFQLRVTWKDMKRHTSKTSIKGTENTIELFFIAPTFVFFEPIILRYIHVPMYDMFLPNPYSFFIKLFS